MHLRIPLMILEVNRLVHRVQWYEIIYPKSITEKESSLKELKTICWGGPNIVPRPDWLKGRLSFLDVGTYHSFGLKVDKGATKAFILLLQSFVLKQIMFDGKTAKKAAK